MSPRVGRFHAVFDSPLGELAVAWSERGLVGVQLPEGSARSTGAKLALRAGSKPLPPPPWVKEVIRHLRDLAAGGDVEPLDVALDDGHVPPFHARVYGALRRVPRGKTCTYGELARLAGRPAAARAVGAAMGRNPWPLIVPCHRVLAAGDRLGGFSATGGVRLKAELLRAESRGPKAAAHARAKSAAKPEQGTLKPAARARVLPVDAEAALAHLRRVDPRLGALIDRVPYTLDPSPRKSTFEALLRTIVYQQLNGKAAATIHGRVLALLPDGKADAGALLGVSPERLRSAGLSRAKTAAVIDLSTRALRGELPEFRELATLDDETIVERLTVVRGIGRWSVEMLLLFWLRRPDVLPVGDFGVREGFRVLMGRRAQPSPAVLERHARIWRPYRSVASWYLWRAVDEARAARERAPAKR